MIFNSLGSNYNFKFVLNSLFSWNKEKYRENLEEYLSKKYSGQVVLLYKGREAIRLALETSGLSKGSLVGVTGFTCFAVYKAVADAGHTPTYIDISPDLDFSLSEIKKQKGLKVLIIQNTLGIPCDILGIANYCKENNVLLIEDLAHSVGARYINGSEAGNVGDFVALSFSQDKMIDAISGGALIIRNKKYLENLDLGKLKEVEYFTQLKDRFYPTFTFKVRKLYPFGLGKVIHFVLKKLNLLSQPVVISDAENIHRLPPWYCNLVMGKFKKLDNDILHKREIASIYAKNIESKLLEPLIVKKINLSSNLRFPIFTEKRNRLFKYLENFGIYISDTWYDSPIAPSKFIKSTNYLLGDCPKSEEISSKIVNLPTHENVSAKDAVFISKLINKWINTK